MTVENQNFEASFEGKNVYRGPKWKIGKIIAIFAIITVTLIIRNLGMVWVYGSVYDQVNAYGFEFKIGFLKYFYMILLFAIPLIFPIIVRIKNGVYFDEPSDSLMPNTNKAVSIILYVVFGVLIGVGGVLSVAGAFTVAHLFVLVNLALIFFSAITLYYYFGTFVLQRAKVSTAYKYIFPTVMMIGSSAVSLVATIFGSRIIANSLAEKAQKFAADNVALLSDDPAGYLKAMPKIYAFPNLFERIDAFKLENTEAGKDIATLVIISAVIIVIGLLVACALYQLTRNFLSAVVPTIALSFGSIVLVNRVREAINYVITDGPKLIESEAKRLERTEKAMRNLKITDSRYEKKKASFESQIAEHKAKIAEIEDKMAQADNGKIIAYVFMGILVAVLLVLLGRSIYVFIKTCKEEKSLAAQNNSAAPADVDASDAVESKNVK